MNDYPDLMGLGVKDCATMLILDDDRPAQKLLADICSDDGHMGRWFKNHIVAVDKCPKMIAGLRADRWS